MVTLMDNESKELVKNCINPSELPILGRPRGSKPAKTGAQRAREYRQRMKENGNHHFSYKKDKNNRNTAKYGSDLLNAMGTKRTNCATCDETFNSTDTLNSHILELHKENSETLRNTACEVNSRFVKYEAIHRRTTQLLLEDEKSSIQNPAHISIKMEPKGLITDIDFQEFIKEEVNETSIDNTLLENEEYSIISIEYETIKTEPETIVPETLSDAITDDKTLFLNDVTAKPFIKEVNDTSTNILSTENELSVVNIQKDIRTKQRHSEEKPFKINKFQKLKVSEEAAVLEVWAKYMTELRYAKRNRPIYAKMCQQLQAAGMDINISVLKNKINNITARYKREKSTICSKGGTSSEWHLYPRVHEILANFKNINEAELVEESNRSFQDEEVKNNYSDGANLSISPINPATTESLAILLPSSPVSDSTLILLPSSPVEMSAVKKKKLNHNETLAKYMKEANEIIKKESKKLIQIEKDMLILEEEKVKSMREFNQDFKELKCEIINYLKSNKAT